MFGQPPSSTRTDPPYPYTTLFRSEAEDAEAEGDVEELAAPASLDDEDNGESRDDHEGAEEATPRGKSRNGDAAAEDLRRKRMALRRSYKIQDVIRRRPDLLVQGAKAERGNKGAALTRHLSTAGRQCGPKPT